MVTLVCLHRHTLLGGSWVVISRVISWVSVVTTHDASSSASVRACCTSSCAAGEVHALLNPSWDGLPSVTWFEIKSRVPASSSKLRIMPKSAVSTWNTRYEQIETETYNP